MHDHIHMLVVFRQSSACRVLWDTWKTKALWFYSPQHVGEGFITEASFLRIGGWTSLPAITSRRGKTGDVSFFPGKVFQLFGKHIFLFPWCGFSWRHWRAFEKQAVPGAAFWRAYVKNRSFWTVAAYGEENRERGYFENHRLVRRTFFLSMLLLVRNGTNAFALPKARLLRKSFYLGWVLVNGMPIFRPALYFLLQSDKKYPSVTWRSIQGDKTRLHC